MEPKRKRANDYMSSVSSCEEREELSGTKNDSSHSISDEEKLSMENLYDGERETQGNIKEHKHMRKGNTEIFETPNVMEIKKKNRTPNSSASCVSSIASLYLQIENELCGKLLTLNYGNTVQYIYNPVDYASELHEDFVTRFCTGRKSVLLLGMNPGPWGMGQTGVPFGHVGYAKDWLGVRGQVKRPAHEHPKRPVLGLECTRKEVSGERMWSLLKELSGGSPEILFKHVFLHNYCPLFFLKDSAKNVTPPELKSKERSGLEEVCDAAVVEVIQLLGVERVVGVGRYATERTKKALTQAGIDNVQVTTLMHPSPVNPAANKGWREIAIKQLTQDNIIQYFKPYPVVT